MYVQQDDRFYQIRFATEDDRKAWENELVAFGSAVVDQHGKHVPLSLLRRDIDPYPGVDLKPARLKPGTAISLKMDD